ncbi:MAG: glycosyltransferase family 2 protein [Deltaproteobacteria bacterium]|jgi:hypothetical protein|nr:glycosyltransferase family 2 protein [Deltaproteobacteria bacterium]MBW2537433.1 glycosyltransferase family 2 protein [Deltaproteobacteria bacterium]
MFELTFLRWVGIVVGLLALWHVIARLRVHASKRGGLFALLVFGLSLLLIGAFPDLANLPAQLLQLRDVPGGRVTTLLLLSTLIAWPLILRERGKLVSLKLAFEQSIRRQAQQKFEQTYADELAEGAVWILIPVLDEAENLKVLIPKIPRTLLGRPVEVIVISDGSTDDSEAVAVRAGARVLSLPINRGGGAALKTGFELAPAHGAVAVVTMDGDGQHNPSELPPLVEPILEDQADVVIGSRLLGTAESASRMRAVGVHVFNWLINALMSTKISDCSSGFRAIRTSTLARLQLTQEQYHTAELIIDAAKRGFRLLDAPITISRRHSGKSRKGKDLIYGLYFLRTIIKTWLR